MTPTIIFLLIINASLLISINTDSICSLKVLRSLRTVYSMLSFINIATPHQIGFVYVFLQHYNLEWHTNHSHHLLTKSLLYQSMKISLNLKLNIENVVWKITAILYPSQCVKYSRNGSIATSLVYSYDIYSVSQASLLFTSFCILQTTSTLLPRDGE